MLELTGDMVAGAGIVLEVRWLDAWVEDKSRDTGHMNRRVRVGFFNYPAQRVAVLEYSTSPCTSYYPDGSFPLMHTSRILV